MKFTKQYQADLLLLLVVAVWGTTFPIMKIILVDTGPFFFIALRFTVAFLALSIFFYRDLKGLKKASLGKGVILGFWLLAGYGLQIAGLQYTTASRSGFITGLAVVLVPILSIFILNEVPGIRSWLGVILATAGLFLLTGGSLKGLNPGDILTFFCALSFGMQIVLLSKYLETEKPVVLTLIQLAVVAGGGFFISLWTGSIGSVSSKALGVIIYTGLMATAFAYLIQGFAQQFTSSTHAALIFTLEPVFAALFAFLILGELMSQHGIIGGLLILAGMLVAELGAEKTEKVIEDDR